MKTRITMNLIAPCGMDCALCLAYLRQRNPCSGCRAAERNKSEARVHCRLRTCEIRAGKFCCDCREFPCDRLQRLDIRYRTRYGMSEIENLEFIRDNGIRKFVAAERKKWETEDGIFCVHDRKYYT